MDHAIDAETFRPSNVPRDLVSLVSILGAGALQAALLLVPSFLIGYHIHEDIDIALNYVLATCVGVCALLLPFVVWSVTIDNRGIRFRRLVGSPKFLPWSRITSIPMAPRGEAIIHGFFFPWQAPSTAVSYLHTFRIDWGRRRFYFPPRDVAGFRAAVRRWRPDLMPPEAEPPEAAKFLPKSEETGNPYQAPLSDLVERPEEPRDDQR